MPRFSSADDQFFTGGTVSPHVSANETTSADGSVVVDLDPLQATQLRLTLTVSAVGGTNPTLDVKVQTRETTSASWRDLPDNGAFAQATGTGSERKVFPGIDRYARVSWAIGGTASPHFTFVVSGEAV